MDYSIDIEVKEFDERSSQFSCVLTIANQGADALEVLAASPRLPQGLRLNEASDASALQLVDRHTALCERLEGVVGAFLIALSPEEATAYAARLHAAMEKVFTTRSLVDISVSRLLRRGPKIFEDMRIRVTGLPITNAREGSRAVGIISKFEPTDVVIQSAHYLLQALDDIEGNPDYVSFRNARSAVLPGQQQKSIYVVQAKRGLLGVKSYCINFSIELRSKDGKDHTSRLESTSVSVSPNPISLTALAVAASAVGAGIRYLTTMPEGTPADAVFNQWPNFLVSALTALVVFNIFDLTRLREQLRASVSWRGAILVGFLCGYLNVRILSAVEALLGTS